MSDTTKPIVVLKFGGSVLVDHEACRTAVHEIYRYFRRGTRVVAVSSAFKGHTDSLQHVAGQLSDRSHEAATAALLRTGELQSAACLAIACDAAGLPATLLDAEQIQLTTSGPILDADPVAVNVDAIHGAFAASSVVVVPGFAGRDVDGRVALLGRGGSDLTALFLADALGAECRLVKDVSGWYNSGRVFRDLNTEDARLLQDRVVQPKAVAFAAERRTRFGLGRAGQATETIVAADASTADAADLQPDPLRVAIAGVGTVGAGVWKHLAAVPTDFIVVGGLVKGVSNQRAPWVPLERLTSDASQLPEYDVLVEALPNASSAYELVSDALRRGASVVSANKDLIARHGGELERLAIAGGVDLRYAAAAGGACPILETATRANQKGQVTSVRAVLNATTNVVLDGIRSGLSFDEAVKHAQDAGYAESDPTTDLNGVDAANKLVLLHHALTGDWLSVDDVSREPVKAGSAASHNARHVAALTLATRRAVVSLEELEDSDPLAQVAGDWNLAIFEMEDGSTHIARGRGAGRWPTAEAVVADAFDIRRALSTTLVLKEAS